MSNIKEFVTGTASPPNRNILTKKKFFFLEGNPCPYLTASLRSRMSEHLYWNAQWIPINSSYGPDSGGPQGQSFGSGSSRTGVAFFQKNSKNSHISGVVAPIELKIAPRARFRASGLLGPFSAHSEHFSYCELDLDDLDLLNFKLEQIRGHFC